MSFHAVLLCKKLCVYTVYTGVRFNAFPCHTYDRLRKYTRFELNLKVMPLECGDEIWRQITSITGLPYGEEIMIVDRTMWAQSTSVTDREIYIRRTDLRWLRPRCAQRRAVKTRLSNLAWVIWYCEILPKASSKLASWWIRGFQGLRSNWILKNITVNFVRMRLLLRKAFISVTWLINSSTQFGQWALLLQRLENDLPVATLPRVECDLGTVVLLYDSIVAKANRRTETCHSMLLFVLRCAYPCGTCLHRACLGLCPTARWIQQRFTVTTLYKSDIIETIESIRDKMY